MRVLIACEESQEVCKAFRARGHEAYSCDVQEPSGGHPEWHILGGALEALNGGKIVTMDGIEHNVGKWDLLIAHPPCTFLTVSGNRWFNVERYGDRAVERLKARKEAAEFFMAFINAGVPRICVENPVGYMSTHYRKPDCIVQPYQFGHPARKTTCLWLKNLPPLIPTDVVNPGEILPGGYSVGASANYATDENGKSYGGMTHVQQRLGAKHTPVLQRQWPSNGDNGKRKEKMMDALKFIEERNRMCERYWQVDGDCDGCPMVNVDECNELRNMVDDAGKAVGKVVEIIEKWSKEHPKKTRQSVFLKQYPNAKLSDNVMEICPKMIDISFSCLLNCSTCKQEFWMQEVE